MQKLSSVAQTHHSLNSSERPRKPVVRPINRADDLARVFNTVMVTTQSKGKRDFSAELCELTDSAPFKAILSAARQLSSIHGISERLAVEQIIQTFRKMDRTWGEYLFREGLERVKSSK